MSLCVCICVSLPPPRVCMCACMCALLLKHAQISHMEVRSQRISVGFYCVSPGDDLRGSGLAACSENSNRS